MFTTYIKITTVCPYMALVHSRLTLFFSKNSSARDAANNASWLERVVVKFLGDETADAVEGWVRSATGLTTVEEAEYKVVVELDADAYSFKIMNAGDLGKRPSA